MLFADLKPEVRDRITGMGKMFRLAPGDWLFEQDDYADFLYVIQTGQISLVLKFRDELMDKLPSLGPGEIIGWSAIVPSHTYKLGAVAEEETILVGFHGENLLNIMESDCEAGYLILKQISELIGDRLVNISTQMMSLKV
jgi:CRP-like cAMP-binding protein